MSTQWNKGKGKTGRRQPYRWPVYLEQNLHDHHDLEEKDEADEHDVLKMVKDTSAHVTEKGSEDEQRDKKGYEGESSGVDGVGHSVSDHRSEADDDANAEQRVDKPARKKQSCVRACTWHVKLDVNRRRAKRSRSLRLQSSNVFVLGTHTMASGRKRRWHPNRRRLGSKSSAARGSR